ncbi:MAG: efflux RND transporter periplasmic adaptor subunit [Sphingomonadales bacterium]
MAAAALALTLAGCGDGGQAPAPRPAAQGQRLKVAAVTVPELKPVAAEVTTRDQAEALVRIPGRLVRLSVREGDLVKRGQAIGMVVDERIGYETSAFQAQIAAASAEADRARAELARIEYLYRNNVYARARLDQAQAAARAANAQVAAARAQRSASASAAGQGAILAPATGRVLRADIPEGSVVAPGMSVATVTSGPPLLRLRVPQSLAGRIHPGAAVSVQDDRLGSRTGTIVQVYPAVSGGQMTADAELAGLTTDLVGQRVSVLLEAGSRQGIVIPKRFLITQFGVDYVDLLGRDGSVARVPVQTAPTAAADRIEILSGLGAGDVVVAGTAQ